MTQFAGAAPLLSEPKLDTRLDPSSLHRSNLLSSVPWIVHGITRRVPGLGRADGNIGYTAPRDREDAWEMRRLWLSAAGLDARTIAVGSQVHGAGVAVVTAGDAGRGAEPGSRSVGPADALITAEPGVVPTTLHADCMAILLCDPVRRVVATIHAGWRGTVADIAGETVRTMADRFGTIPGDLLGYLGPAIGACCYEVGDDVRDAWEAAGRDVRPYFRPSGERWLFDLAAANRWLLERAGVPAGQIEESGICTRCNGGEWFSHRGQGPETGRFGAFIALCER